MPMLINRITNTKSRCVITVNCIAKQLIRQRTKKALGEMHRTNKGQDVVNEMRYSFIFPLVKNYICVLTFDQFTSTMIFASGRLPFDVSES